MSIEEAKIKTREPGMEPESRICDKGRHEELEKEVVKNEETECILAW